MMRNLYNRVFLIGAIVLFPALVGMLQAQTIWNEPFNYPDMTTVGLNNNTVNPALDWGPSSCPTCISGDWFEVRNNKMEGRDTNGPASLTTEVIDISAWPAGVEISVGLSKQGTMEGCPMSGSGCNSTDFIRIEYELDGNGFQDWTSAFGGPCSAPCTGDTYVTLGDFNDFTYTVCPVIANTIRLRISVQNWANDEFLRIDDITIAAQTCNPFQNIASVTDVLCQGQSNGSITINSSGGQPPYTYSLNGGLPQSSSTFSFLPAGTYTVVIEDDNGSLDTLTGLLVSAPPALLANVSSTAAGCTANIGSVTALASGGTPGYTYLWNTNPAQNSSTATGLSPGTYFCTITDANGCTRIDSATVPSSSPLTLVADPDVQICSSAGGVMLGGTVSGGDAPFSWTWSCNTANCMLDSLNDDDPMANPAFTTTYYAQVSDSGGCVSNVDSILVTILPSPFANAGRDTSICAGDSAVLQGSGSGIGPTYTYLWSPSASLSDPTSASPLASPTAPTWYELVVTSGGCPSPPDSVLVDFIPPAVADAGPDSVICRGDSIMLIGSGSGQPGAIFSYYWLSGPDTLATNDSLQVAPASTSTFVLTVDSDPGCGSLPDSVLVIVEQPFVHPAPEASIEFCLGEPVTIGVDAENGYTYHWEPITGLQDPNQSITTVAPSESVTYTLQITNDALQSANCRTQNFPVSLQDGNCILPNVITPNGDGINDLLVFGPYVNAINLVIYDRWGKEVFRQNGYQNNWSGTNMSGQVLPEGVYFYVLEANVVSNDRPGDGNQRSRFAGSLTLLR
jgi:gliding motility-associated-like protein